ncbi:MAG TPA: FAD/NAD(P)-binding protein [Spirochaetia bacterium]|nr:FAD/NAD(P)-binding protein [Spirochaetia bacterium]
MMAATSVATRAAASRNIYVPEIADLVRVEKMSPLETLFEVRLPGGRGLGHQPGQFVQVSLLGIGEAPISISSSPLARETFELVVRDVGNLTSALHRLKAGDRIGIRGPFGKGFDVEQFLGKDVVFVAGGIGLPPLRSLINTMLHPGRRGDFGRIIVLYGTRTPAEFIFNEERASWENSRDLEYHVTVDRATAGWSGHVGVITTLIPDLTLDVANTVAVICGPPVMYKFAILALRSKGLRDEQIYVSLERKMKCGVGKCGHCQINNIYVCQEGPVFNYGKIKDLKEAIQ